LFWHTRFSFMRCFRKAEDEPGFQDAL
jgi:hypothetical protein